MSARADDHQWRPSARQRVLPQGGEQALDEPRSSLVGAGVRSEHSRSSLRPAELVTVAAHAPPRRHHLDTAEVDLVVGRTCVLQLLPVVVAEANTQPHAGDAGTDGEAGDGVRTGTEVVVVRDVIELGPTGLGPELTRVTLLEDAVDGGLQLVARDCARQIHLDTHAAGIVPLLAQTKHALAPFGLFDRLFRATKCGPNLHIIQ